MTEATEIQPNSSSKTAFDLAQLWDVRLSVSVAMAVRLYSSDGAAAASLPKVMAIKELRRIYVDAAALEFRRILLTDTPTMPKKTAEQRHAVVRAIWQNLRRTRLGEERPHLLNDLSDANAVYASGLPVEEIPSRLDDLKSNKSIWAARLIIAMQPVRLLRTGMMTIEICAALHDFRWNSAMVALSKPDRHAVEEALAITLAALPPDEMKDYWKNLQSGNPRIRQSMRLGLKFFRSAHAVPHLLATLEHVEDHDIRAEIVDILEQIGEPSALPVLMRLKKQTAQTDWPLSRHIGRAIKIIERHDRNLNYTNLLRSSGAPPANPDELLRPASAAQFDAERDKGELLRPENKPPENNL